MNVKTRNRKNSESRVVVHFQNVAVWAKKLTDLNRYVERCLGDYCLVVPDISIYTVVVVWKGHVVYQAEFTGITCFRHQVQWRTN